MDRNNIDLSVVFAYGRLHDEFHHHNQTLCDAVIEHPSRLVGFVRPRAQLFVHRKKEALSRNPSLVVLPFRCLTSP